MVRSAGRAIVGNELLEFRLMIVAKNDRNTYRRRRGAPPGICIREWTERFWNGYFR